MQQADSTLMKEVSSISTEFDDLGGYFSLKDNEEKDILKIFFSGCSNPSK